MEELKQFVLKKISKDNFDMVSKKDLLNIISDLRSYGLKWEEHPEEVEKKIESYYPILKSFEKETETINLEGEEFRIPAIKNIMNDPNKPMNYLIEGDNLHGLHAIRKVLRGKVHVIYIDPPYNTGNEFVYNDKKVGEDDSYRHSKWLSFMHKRLEIARELLSYDGVIFISIDDNEQAQLKLLCDKVFGEESFINTVCIKMSDLSGPKMNHVNKKFPKLKEYAYIYAKKKESFNLKPIKKMKPEWDYEYRSFVENMSIRDYEKIVNYDKKNKEYLSELISNFKVISVEEAIEKYNVNDNISDRYNFLKKNSYRIFRTSNSSTIKSILDENEYDSQYVLLDYKEKEIFEIGITTYDKKASVPRVQCVFAKKTMLQPIGDIWMDINTSGLHSEGKIEFKNGKKPLKLIKRFLKSYPKKNLTCLDFFAGSGTLGQAVLELNEEDGGNRQFIMMTNNETANFYPKKYIMDYLEEKGIFSRFRGSKVTSGGKLSQSYKSHLESTIDWFIDLKNKDYKSLYLKSLEEFINDYLLDYIPLIGESRHECYLHMLNKGLIKKEIKTYSSYFNADGSLSHYYEKYLDDIFPFTIEETEEGDGIGYNIVLDREHDKIYDILNDEDFLSFIDDVIKVYQSKGICHNVTYRRMEKVMNGYTDNNNEVEGLGGNLTYLKTGFVKKSFDKDYQRKELSKEIFNLIKIKENTISEVGNNEFKLFFNQNKVVGYYSGDLDYSLLNKVKDELLNSSEEIKILYTKFSPNLKDKLFIEMRKHGIELKQIPESLLYL